MPYTFRSSAADQKANNAATASEANNEDETDLWRVQGILNTRVVVSPFDGIQVRQWQVSWMPSNGETFDPTWEARDCFVGNDGTVTEQFLAFEAKRLL